MSNYRYSTKDFDKEHMARAIGVALPISTKFSVEICRWIRNKKLDKAKGMLKDVIEQKRAVPFKTFNRDLGHKNTTKGAGRYPIKASKEILGILESVEANAQFAGLNTGSLVLSHICAQRASSQMHYGRQRGRQMKRTTIEVVVKEVSEEKVKDPKQKKEKSSAKVEKAVKENKDSKDDKKEAKVQDQKNNEKIESKKEEPEKVEKKDNDDKNKDKSEDKK